MILFVQCDIVTVRKKLQVYVFFQLKIVELHGLFLVDDRARGVEIGAGTLRAFHCRLWRPRL